VAPGDDAHVLADDLPFGGNRQSVGVHAQAHRPVRILDQIIAPEAAVHDLTRVAVDPVHLKDSLGNIQSVRRGMHLGTSVLQGLVAEM